MESPIVIQLQADAIDENTSVSTVLRKAKLIAAKLDAKEIFEWINFELNGCKEGEEPDLPEYRKISGRPMVLNPYQGWQPILCHDDKAYKKLSNADCYISIGEVEALLSGEDDGTYMIPFTGRKLKTVQTAIKVNYDCAVFVQKSSLENVLSAVRNYILDWSLLLSESGVVGEGLTFSDQERSEARPVTQNFTATNINIMGSTHGNSKVQISQGVGAKIDVEELKKVLIQINNSIELLPENMRNDIKNIVDELEVEIENKDPRQNWIRKRVEDIRAICSGAIGNLAASGILGILPQ